MSTGHKNTKNGNKKANSQSNNGRRYTLIDSSDIITGIAGAFIGSIFGVAFWVFIYYLGYIPCVAGIALIICAFQGYKVLGGILDTKGIVISSILTIVMIQLANQITWAIELYTNYKAETGMTFWGTFQNLFELLTKYKLMNQYVSDLGFGCLWAVIGCVIVIVNMVRASKEQ